MKTLLIFFLIFVCFFCEAQNENSSWCFGDSAGIDFKNVNNPQPFNTSVQSRGSCGSISDSLGNLLKQFAPIPALLFLHHRMIQWIMVKI